jgi:B12-binding domain/radical SAM domain protein
MRLFGTDLVLLHPPSVYDFREAGAEYGPISDVIFSTPAFEMYPVGLTSIASHLESQGHNVRIVNLAQRMVSEPTYDAERAVASLDPALFGIDLHWMPHAHGALKVAELVKRHHPHTPVLFGGLTASYFQEELIRSPFVDFVLRGDSTEEPALRLLRAVLSGGDFESIPNLTWKRRDGSVAVNPLSYVPPRLDGDSVPDIFYVVRSVFKYRSLRDVVPFNGWLNYPVTALLTSRGCSMQCVLCGGSRAAYRTVCERDRPALRPPGMLAGDIRRIEKFSRGPVFLINDLRMGGAVYAARVLELLARTRPKNEIILELFSTVADDYLERVGAALPRWSLEITLESHVERIRRLNRRFACPDEEIERTIGEALKNGAGRIDIFFMVGLPGQSYEDAIGFDSFCRRLLERFKGDPRLEFFVAPLAPFLDPGSSAYEQPARHGYRVRFHTLEEHRAALAAPSWKEMLNYETDLMTREEIAAATYEALRRLTRLKREWGFINAEDCAASLQSIAASERAVGAVDAALRLPEGARRDEAVREARAGACGPAAASLFQKNYLVWPLVGGRRFAPLWSLAFVGVGLALREARLLVTRRLPLYLSQLEGKTATRLSRGAGAHARGLGRVTRGRGGGGAIAEVQVAGCTDAGVELGSFEESGDA